LRALLEDLPASVDVAMVVRASTTADIVLRDEVAALIRERGGRFLEVVGSRHKVRMDATTLRRLVPDLAARDVYICGPQGFSERVAKAASRMGVKRDRIHQEGFTF
jgi:ferredoxin-NADP reductase